MIGPARYFPFKMIAALIWWLAEVEREEVGDELDAAEEEVEEIDELDDKVEDVEAEVDDGV